MRQRCCARLRWSFKHFKKQLRETGHLLWWRGKQCIQLPAVLFIRYLTAVIFIFNLVIYQAKPKRQKSFACQINGIVGLSFWLTHQFTFGTKIMYRQVVGSTRTAGNRQRDDISDKCLPPVEGKMTRQFPLGAQCTAVVLDALSPAPRLFL